MQQQFKVFGLILLVFGIIGVVGTIAASILMFSMAYGMSELLSQLGSGGNYMPGLDHHNSFVDTLYGWSLQIFIFAAGLIISVLFIIAGVGLRKRKPWARVITIIISIASLPGVPFWTALGVYGLWMMLSTDGINAWHVYLESEDSSPIRYA